MRQKLGQHFLVNPEIPIAIADALQVSEGDVIIEVGPGHGELTAAIVDIMSGNGLKTAKLIAVEKDPELAEQVRRRFEEYPFVEVIKADILRFMSDSKLTAGSDKMVGNLPYYLTGHLLRAIGERERRPTISAFMVQKEVADRLSAKPPRMNRLAASVQFWADPKIMFYVSKKEFDPPPEVDSAVILLEAKEDAGESPDAYYSLIRRLFSQPRKTILNNISGKDHKRREEVSKMLQGLSIDPDSRPQDLSVAEIVGLSKVD